ncbi:N-acetyl-1-D-myo-inositol-2-amino-2-deoxy-alpha-D-glucopyranoside deacetylase [Paraoerskovia marina]|uniref:N-acetyl-1-D-myo-inositol-2-amino-2-deoxy-alpha-D-glucopyranoside deacetylase n=1 Tax=Paraoerskovia marina TaxID=545619 RepID=A0A1H1UPK5_9CELL|nr:PIG-L family deacetylase [Paraoerskovia marina]SDS74393.1 N-acetyl-1-D-myo-inositol-2-amino-2-deoxy-alpha-D-glucopyranoside deacetylase [Paraoerskovia marina]
MNDGASRTEQPVAPRGGLLVVHAHPDDETLTNGALLATWAAAGEPVTVVTCTRGERGEVIGEELAHLEGDGPALAAHREGELAQALAALGVQGHDFLDGGPGVLDPRTASDGVASPGTRYQDSGMAWVEPGVADRGAAVPDGAFVDVPLDEAAARLVALIERSDPAVVVTYEPGGGYGHPDHVRAHEVVARAGELLGDACPELWWSVQPESVVRTARSELAAGSVPDGMSVPAADAALPSAVVPDGMLGDALVVDVRPVLPAVLAALRAHATQVQGVVPISGAAAIGRYALSNDVLAPVLPIEVYLPRPARPSR